MNVNELQRRIRELSPEFLKKLIAYWNGLPAQKRAGYFQDDDAIVATEELTYNGIPLQFRLKILRLDLSLAPHAIAVVAAQGIKVSILAFRITEELKVDEKHIMNLVEAYEMSYPELCHEIQNYR